MTEKRNLIIGIVIVAVIVVLGILTLQPFVIAGISKVDVGLEEGKPFWVIEIIPEGAGEQIFFTAKKQELTPVNDPRGGKWVADEGFSLTFDREPPTCIYTLTKSRGADSWKLSLTARREALLKIIPSKGEPAEVDGFQGGITETFRKGNGEINVRTLGALVGPISCAQTSGDFFVSERNGTLTYHKGFIGKYTGRADRQFPLEYRLGCSLDKQNSELSCKKSFDELGSPVLIVNANADYVNARYIPPKTGKPKVLEVDAGDQLQEGKQSGLRVRVRNVGSSEGNFRVTIRSDRTAVQQNTQTLFLNAGETKDVNFGIVGGIVEGQDSVTSMIEAEMCTITQFQRSECDKKSINIDVQNVGIFTPLSCGNDKCDSNENFATCATDCPQPCGDDPNMVRNQAGQCQCLEGEITYDRFGRTPYCSEEKPFPWPIVLIIGAFAIIAIIMVLIAKRKK